jgi:hypothetical protein
VHAQIVPLEERVVPERVYAQAGVEAEVDERDRSEARLVLGPEGEEVVDRAGDVRALGGHLDGPDGPADQVLGGEVHRREDHARHPEQILAQRGSRGRAPRVIGGLALGGLVGVCDGRKKREQEEARHGVELR